MFDSIGVRIALFFYIIFASVALFLLWRNSAAPDALKNAGILLASILPVIIVVYPYLKQERITHDFTFNLFYDAQEKQIVAGDDFNSYGANYIHMFTNLSMVPDALNAKDISEAMEVKGLNIIEKGIIETLLLKFMTHWDIETKKFEGPISKSESWGASSKLPSIKIELSKIQNLFKHNPFVATPNILVHPTMCIPQNTEIIIKNDEKSRAIIFKNPYTTIEISIRFSSMGVAQHGVWGVLKIDPKNPNRYYVIEYRIVASQKINKTKVYAPEMGSYRRWFENICDMLQKFDWSTVNQQIEKSLTREAVSKILEMENP